jgi:hypothetical protein
MGCLWFAAGSLKKLQRSRKYKLVTSSRYTKLWLLTASLSIVRGDDF